MGTLVYGSTQATEKNAGAAFVDVAPVRTGLHRNGLRARTYFHPSTLLPVPREHLPAPAGFLGRSVVELRKALRFALGIGTGSCLVHNAPAGSLRGRLVVLSATLEHEIGAVVAIILTEPQYSAEKHYQIILPIFAASTQPAANHDLLVPWRDWLQALPAAANAVLLAIPATHSIWHHDDIARETEFVVDDETLAEIDRRLCEYFSLGPVSEG